MDALQFQLKLVDQMSAPLGAETKALGALEKEMLRAQAVLKSFEAQQKSMRQAKAAAAGPDALKAFQLGEDQKIARQQAAIAKKRVAEQGKAERLAARESERVAKEQERAVLRVMAQQAKAEKAAQKEADRAAKASANQQAKAEKLALKEADRAKKAQAKDLVKQQAAMDEALAASTSEMMAFAGAAGAAAGAVAVLAGAMGAVVIAGASLAIEASEAKGDTVDMLEAMLGSAEAADRTYAAISDITRDLAVSQQGVQALASELSAAGVTNEAMLLDAVKSVSQVDSVIKGAGAKIEKIVEKAAQTGKFKLNEKALVGTGIQTQKLYEELAARTGKGVKEVEAQLKAGKISAEVGIAALTKVIDTKFGAVASKQALDFSAQMQRLKDNFGKLFEDVDTGPFLEAVSKIVRLFDAATPAGKALHDVVTGFYDAFFSAVSKVEPYVTTFFKGLIILGLRIGIALKPLLRQLGMIGDQTDGAQGLADTMSEIAFVIGNATAAVVNFLSYSPLWDPLIESVEFAADAFGLLLDANMAVISGITWLIDTISDVISWIGGLDDAAIQAGVDVATGLAEGIVNAGPAFIDAIVNLATEGWQAFRSIFDSHSPSRVMMGEGENLVLGLVKGIDTNAPAANDALEHAVQPPRVTNLSSVTSNSSGPSIVFRPGAIVIQGANMSPAEVEDMLTRVMANIFENVALQSGTQPENAEEEAA